MSDEKPLELEAVGHDYGTTPVFDDVSLGVEPGEFVAVLGSSGCGKTTLLRTVAGLVTPARGTVRIGGIEVARDGEELVRTEQRNIGLVFQEYALFPSYNVRANVGFGVARRDRDRVERLLELIGMKELAKRKPHELSGGQQQRVALARALAPSPKLLLLDEPFANVDATLRSALGADLRRMVTEENVSVVMVTHDRSDALGLADRVAIVAPGSESGSDPHQKTGSDETNAACAPTLVQVDSPETVYREPVSRHVAELTGSVIALAARCAGATASTELGKAPIQMRRDGPATVLARPEQLRFEKSDDGPCRIEARSFAGRGFTLFASTPAGDIQIEEDSASPATVGDRGKVSFRSPCWVVSS